MSSKEILEKLRTVIINFDIEGCKKTAQEALELGVSSYEAIMEGMAKGIEVVGEKYSSKEYFLPELVMAGETMKAGMQVLMPHLSRAAVQKMRRVLIGTVEGDLHDIGKNIVTSMLASSGFNVIDLGVDVSAEVFVEKTRELKPDIVAMSALLTSTMPAMKKVIDALRAADLRNRVKIMVGGRPLTEEYAKQIGADAYGKDAIEAAKKAKQLLDERR